MKRLTLFFVLCVCSINMFSQNITNTLGTSGAFKIKDATNNYLTVSQPTGYLSLYKSLVIPNSTDSTLGVIFKGTDRFIHNYSSNSLDGYNTFIGINSGNFTMTGGYNTAIGDQSLFSNTDGYGNIALGFQSLYSNTTGFQNTAVGLGSLQNNTSAYNNTAVGYLALNLNTTGYHNTASGTASLQNNTTGEYNTASGTYSLNNNTSGHSNTASGASSLYSNTTGNGNTASGRSSLFFNTTGSDNTALGLGTLQLNTEGIGNTAMGFQSLYNNTTGFYNTAIGVYSGSNITTGKYNTAIGYYAEVPNGAANNQVRIGNEFVTYAGVQVAWTITSDKRWKTNNKNSALGLNFISKLNPVSYTRINDENQRIEFGLIAQEVEDVLKESGIENAGMLTIDDSGRYELRYNDLLAPMIKAIQELKKEKDVEIAELKTANDELKSTTFELKERLSKIEQMQKMLVAEIEKLKINNNETTKVSLGE